jgi:2-iminobutanoate/2-iminopropanoate deaminase
VIRPIHPQGFAPPSVPLSPGVQAGDLVFVSGQIASRPDGTLLLGDFAAEAELALANVEAVVTAGGGTVASIVKVNAYLSNAILFAAFNEVYARRFAAAPPARTTVIVDFGHPDVRVEVEAVAYLG